MFTERVVGQAVVVAVCVNAPSKQTAFWVDALINICNCNHTLD